MKFSFKLSLPLRHAGHVSAETECALSSTGWKERLSELVSQAADASPEDFPRDLTGHPGRLDSTLVDDFMDKL